MPKFASSYYPPRAHDRWVPASLGRALDRAGVRLRRCSQRFPVRVSPSSVPLEQWTLALVLPGYAYALLGRRTLAWGMVLTWVTALLLYLVFLGNPWLTGWALGALASAHVSGLGFLVLRDREQDPDGRGLSLAERLGIPLGFWVGYLMLLYWPAGQWFQQHLALPVQLNEQTYVFNATSSPRSLTRGEIVAYRLDRGWAGVVQVQRGYTMGAILGLPGDRIEFGENEVRVNGRVQPRAPEMPRSGELIVEPNTRFIWPVLSERVINIDRAQVNHAYLQLASVPEQNLVGRPFRHWFFRRQTIP